MTATSHSSNFFKDFSPSVKSSPVSPVSPYLLIFFIPKHININFTISHFLGFTSHSYFYSVSFRSSFFKKMVCVLKLLKSDFCTHHCSEIDYTKISNNLLLGLLQWRLFNLFLDLATLDVHWCFLLIFCYFFISTFTLTFLVNCSLSLVSSSISLKEYMLQGSVLSQYLLLLCSFCWIISLLYILPDYFL